nr:hypothetical protein 1 [Paracoccaceae bacterium]
MIGLPVELAERENTSIDFKKEDALDCVRKVFENDETQVYKQQLIDALMYDLPHAEVLARSKEWQEVAKILKSSNETKCADLADVLALVRRISS